jgi:hypothetical protein
VGGQIGYKLPDAPQLRLSAGGFWITLPDFFLGKNSGAGWKVTDRATVAEAQWFFHKRRGGVYLGVDALYEHRTLSKDGMDGMAGEAAIDHVIGAIALGYSWFPFATRGLYVTPVFTLAIQLHASGSTTVGSATFAESHVLPLPAVNIGWELY